MKFMICFLLNEVAVQILTVYKVPVVSDNFISRILVKLFFSDLILCIACANLQAVIYFRTSICSSKGVFIWEKMTRLFWKAANCLKFSIRASFWCPRNPLRKREVCFRWYQLCRHSFSICKWLLSLEANWNALS